MRAVSDSEVYLTYKSSSGKHIGVAKYGGLPLTNGNPDWYAFVDCSASTPSGSKCFGEVTAAGPSGTVLLAGNVKDADTATDYLTLHLINAGAWVWDYVIKLGASASTYYEPKQIEYITGEAFIVC